MLPLCVSYVTNVYFFFCYTDSKHSCICIPFHYGIFIYRYSMFCCTYSFYVLFYTVLFFPTVDKLYSNRLPGVWPQMEQRPIKKL